MGEVEGGVGGVIGLSSIAVTLYGRRPDETAVRKRKDDEAILHSVFTYTSPSLPQYLPPPPPPPHPPLSVNSLPSSFITEAHPQKN